MSTDAPNDPTPRQADSKPHRRGFSGSTARAMPHSWRVLFVSGVLGGLGLRRLKGTSGLTQADGLARAKSPVAKVWWNGFWFCVFSGMLAVGCALFLNLTDGAIRDLYSSPLTALARFPPPGNHDVVGSALAIMGTATAVWLATTLSGVWFQSAPGPSEAWARRAAMGQMVELAYLALAALAWSNLFAALSRFSSHVEGLAAGVSIGLCAMVWSTHEDPEDLRRYSERVLQSEIGRLRRGISRWDRALAPTSSETGRREWPTFGGLVFVIGIALVAGIVMFDGYLRTHDGQVAAGVLCGLVSLSALATSWGANHVASGLARAVAYDRPGLRGSSWARVLVFTGSLSVLQFAMGTILLTGGHVRQGLLLLAMSTLPHVALGVAFRGSVSEASQAVRAMRSLLKVKEDALGRLGGEDSVPDVRPSD